MIPALPLEHLQSPLAIAAYVLVILILAVAATVRQLGKSRAENERLSAELRARTEEAHQARWAEAMAGERIALNEANQKLVDRLMKRESDLTHERGNLMQAMVALKERGAACERDSMRMKQNIMGLLTYISQLSGILAAHGITVPSMPFPLPGSLPEDVEADRRHQPSEGAA